MIRAAIIGCGGIAWAHANGYKLLNDKVKVVAVADIDKGAASRLGAALASDVYTDYNELLRRQDIDMVDICLPHKMHKKAIIESLESGKNTMCEKPMCLTIEEADEIVSTAKKVSVKFMPAHNQIFVPAVQEAKRLIDSDLIGRTLFLRTQDCFQNRGIGGWRTNVAEMGGGELIDTGYHPNYVLNYLARSTISSVYALGTRHRIQMNAEDTGFVTITFEDGSIGNIHSSWAYDLLSGGHLFHIVGERGELFGDHFLLGFKIHGMTEAKREWASTKNSFTNEIEHFVGCIESDKQPLQTAEDGRNVVRLIRAEYSSIESGQPVTLNSVSDSNRAAGRIVTQRT